MLKFKASQICSIHNALQELGQEKIDGKTAQKVSFLITDEMERIVKACDSGRNKITSELQIFDEQSRQYQIPAQNVPKYNQDLMEIYNAEYEIKKPENIVTIDTSKNPDFVVKSNLLRILKDYIEVI